MSLINVYLARYERGWTEIGSLASEVANGRAEGLLALGGVTKPASVQAIVDELVAATGASYVASIAGIEPAASGQHPYVGFVPYDRVNLLAPSGGPAVAKVRGITAVADVNGHPVWTIEANNLAVEGEQNVRTWLRRSMPTFAGGLTETANPATPASVAEKLSTAAKEWRTSKDGAVATGLLTSPAENIGSSGHLNRFTVTLTTAATSGNTVVVLKVSGTTVATVTIPAGTNTGFAAFLTPFVQTDTFTVEVTAVGTGASRLVATARWF